MVDFKRSSMLLAGLLPLMPLATHANDDATNQSIVSSNTVTAPSWIATVGGVAYGRWQHFCSGTLIDKQWVLIAARCALETSDPMEVVVGVTDLSSPHTRSKVDQVLIHPQYFNNIISVLRYSYSDGSLNNSDIALLHLDKPVTQAPIRLADVNIKDTWLTSITPLSSYGYRSLDPKGKEYDHLLRAVNLVYEGDQDIWHDEATTTHIFASDQNAQRVCFGDSSGPLTYADTLVGFTSYGAFPCGMGPGGYVYVPAFIDWIATQQQGVTLTTALSQVLPLGTSGWRDFLLANRTTQTVNLSDIVSDAPEMSHNCPNRLEAGRSCTLRLRADGNGNVDSFSINEISVTVTDEEGKHTYLEGAMVNLIGEPIKPEPIKPEPIKPEPSKPEPTPPPSGESGGGGAISLSALLLLPLVWLRQRRYLKAQR